MIENEISDYQRSKHMDSYVTWKQWDRYEEEYTWCMKFLLEKFVEGDDSEMSLRSWLFD